MCNLDLAQRFLKSTGVKDHIMSMNARIIEDLSINFSLLNNVYQHIGIGQNKLDAVEIFIQNTEPAMDEIILVMEEMVSRLFTNEEAEAIIKFHESPFGIHFENTMPVFLQKVAEEFSELINGTKNKVESEIKERFSKAMQDKNEGRKLMQEFTKEVSAGPNGFSLLM